MIVVKLMIRGGFFLPAKQVTHVDRAFVLTKFLIPLFLPSLFFHFHVSPGTALSRRLI